MELDKKLKVEALLVVHPAKSRQEIDELIVEANRTVFVSGHRQVSLMAGRKKEIVDETTEKWDIFFVEKEKREEKGRQKEDKPFTKVYQKGDKGKNKVGSVPDLTIKDNLPPLTQNTPPATTEAQEEVQNQPIENTSEEEKAIDVVDPESNVLFTMKVDTQNINITIDDTSIPEIGKDQPTDTPLNIDIDKITIDDAN